MLCLVKMCYSTLGNFLSPIVTFSAAALHIFHRLLVFSAVSADEPHGARSALDGGAVVRADAARHLVRLDRAAAVRLDVVVSVLLLSAVLLPAAARAALLPRPRLEVAASLSCLCNIMTTIRPGEARCEADTGINNLSALQSEDSQQQELFRLYLTKKFHL